MGGSRPPPRPASLRSWSHWPTVGQSRKTASGSPGDLGAKGTLSPSHALREAPQPPAHPYPQAPGSEVTESLLRRADDSRAWHPRRAPPHPGLSREDSTGPHINVGRGNGSATRTRTQVSELGPWLATRTLQPGAPETLPSKTHFRAEPAGAAREAGGPLAQGRHPQASDEAHSRSALWMACARPDGQRRLHLGPPDATDAVIYSWASLTRSGRGPRPRARARFSRTSFVLCHFLAGTFVLFNI